MKYPRNIKWWQLALAAIVISAIGGLSSGRPNKSERALYEQELKQAPWAPPGWLFAPAWTFNNIFLLMALNRLLRSNMDRKKTLLGLQAGIWIIFFTFGYIYFNRKSPVLASIWTVSDAALAIASIIIASRVDKKLAADYISLAVWTTFASTVAVYQALNNPDPLLNIN